MTGQFSARNHEKLIKKVRFFSELERQNFDLWGISWAEMLFGVTSQGPTRDV
jgi:hypothetical protein